jgi:DNA primase
MISQKSVQEILDAARIEEVVGDFISLKRRGSNLLGLCPFHNEKTPSFNVSPVRGTFKCFGCGKGGNAVNFLMEHESLSYPEALRWIAKRYKIAIEETEISKEFLEEKRTADGLYAVNEYALKYYQHILFETDKGKSIGLSYFKQRGFNEETVRKFGLGFAPETKDEFTQTAVKAQYLQETLQKVGLTSHYGRDFFRNRVIFPIHSLTGRPIAFGGRILTKEPNAPKYINSPETDIYVKSKSLYGIYFARKAMQQLDECLLVEGYTDVISLHQAGIENVVASSGTSLTVDQIRLIKRFTQNIKIIYDGDGAGIKAALRGLDMVLEEDMNVKIALFPNGEDPDSYLQKVGTAAFNDFIKQNAKDFIFFKTDLLLQEAGEDPVKKTKLIKDIVASVAKISDSIKRGLYLRQCAALMEVDEKLLIDETGKLIKKSLEAKLQSGGRPAQQMAPEEVTQPSDSQPLTNDKPTEKQVPKKVEQPKEPDISAKKDEVEERYFVEVLIRWGHRLYDAASHTTVAAYAIANIQDVLNSFDNKLYQKIVDETVSALERGILLNSAYFSNHRDPNIQKFALDVLTVNPEHEYADWERYGVELHTQKIHEENFALETPQAILRFKFAKINKICKQNLNLINKYYKAGDRLNGDKHNRIHMKLESLRNSIATQLGIVVLK